MLYTFPAEFKYANEHLNFELVGKLINELEKEMGNSEDKCWRTSGILLVNLRCKDDELLK